MSKYTGQKIRVVTAEIRRDGRYLITQRLSTSTLPLLWEFPGGRVGTEEAPERALARFLRERLGVEPKVGELVMAVVHEYEHYVVDMQVFRCDLPDEHSIEHRKINDHRWVLPSEFSEYEFPGADEASISALLDVADPDEDPGLLN